MKQIWLRLLFPIVLAFAAGLSGCANEPDSEEIAEADEALSIIPGYDLTNTPASVAIGSNATADFVAPAGHSATDWVGLYPVGGQLHEWLAYSYVGAATSGTISITLPATAVSGQSYELRYFLNNGYTQGATSSSFLATDPVVGYGLNTPPSFPSPGSNVGIGWTAPSNHSTTDWIGLFATGGQVYEYVSWAYVGAPGATSGSATLQLPANAAPGATYEFRYFLNNGYTVAATSNAFTIGNGLTVPAGPVAPGADIITTWTAPGSHSVNDWVGLYPVGAADSSFVDWAYIGASGQTTGTVTTTMPLTAQDGELYELRYFLDNTYTLAGKSASIVVGQAYTLTGPSGTVSPGTDVNGDWTAPSYHSATDWIGLYAAGAPATSFLSYAYVGAPGVTSGTTAVSIPANTSPGTYELRYLTNNSYTVVATSASFLVGCATGLGDCDGNPANGCETDTTTDEANCGSCGNACTVGTCSASTCQTPTVLATGIPTAGNLATDGTSLFFGSGGLAPQYPDGSVRSVPLAGGTQTTLVSNIPTVEGIALDGSNVVFTSLGHTSNFDDGFLGRVPKIGGTHEVLSANQGYSLWVENVSGTYYWINAGTAANQWADGAVRSAVGGANPTTIATETNPTGVVVEGGYVYWLSGGSPGGSWNDGALRRQAVGGGSTETLVSPLASAGQMIAVNGNIYFAVENAVLTVSTAAPTTPTTFNSDPNDAGRFATDGTYLYWTEPAGRVVRKPLAGGALQVLAQGYSQPYGILVYAGYVYFTARGTGVADGSLHRLAL